MNNVSISMAEWLEELQRVLKVSTSSADGVTVAELAASTGLKPSTINKKLREVAAFLVVGHRQEPRIDGVLTWKPCYRVKEDGGGSPS